MSTICLAPLGMQPGAVVAPLLSLGLAQGDEIVLLTTEPIQKAGIAERSEELLRQRLSAVGVRSADLAAELAGMASFERVVLLINGGEAATVHQLTDRLQALPENTRVEFAESRGVSGAVFGWAVATTRTFQVGDVGLSELLKLLGIKKSSSGKQLTSRIDPEKFLRVEEVLESAGSLYACIALEADPGIKDRRDIKNARLEAYRSLLRWQTLQQDFGLELRRLLIDTPSARFDGDSWPSRLLVRARRDGIPACGQLLADGSPLDRACWRQLVGSGEAASLPENLDIAETPSESDYRSVRGTGAWRGAPLIAMAGTQPGTILRAVWGHQSARATLVVDDSPAVQRNVVRLRAALASSGVEQVDFVALEKLVALSAEDGSHVCLTSGDKSSKFRLALFARKTGLTTCYLDGASVSCGEGRAVVPLRVWVHAHADSKVSLAQSAESRADAGRIQRARSAALTVKQALQSRGLLGDHGEPPERAFAAVKEACGRVRGGGFWLEDLAIILLSAACEETTHSAVMSETGESTSPLDELDALTSLSGHYTLWSCKTMLAEKRIIQAARQARAQATRFLGRREVAVVIVPAFSERSRRYRAGPGWLQFDELTWAVDLGFLSDPGKVAKLAGSRPSGPRGPGRWNPFTS